MLWFYDVVLAHWEIVLFVPILNKWVHKKLLEKGIVQEVTGGGLTVKGFWTVVGFSFWSLLATGHWIAPILVAPVVWWALKSSYFFSGSHKGRKPLEYKAYRVLGFGMVGAFFVPAIFFALGIPLPLWGDFSGWLHGMGFPMPFWGEIASWNQALVLGVTLFSIVHALFNIFAPIFGVRPASLFIPQSVQENNERVLNTLDLSYEDFQKLTRAVEAFEREYRGHYPEASLYIVSMRTQERFSRSVLEHSRKFGEMGLERPLSQAILFSIDQYYGDLVGEHAFVRRMGGQIFPPGRYTNVILNYFDGFVSEEDIESYNSNSIIDRLLSSDSPSSSGRAARAFYTREPALANV
ncbi:MAG: hypothetical protein HYY63_05270, partial [Elusimicrobia bacterium]|nr:hypothetical protein [Elusimicrobiota bacterium]